jgi:hypothetical protein
VATKRTQAAKQAVENSEALKNMQKAIQDTIGPVGEVDIPEKHLFLAERLHELNATVPYSGFSRAFRDAIARPGRFEKEARRKAHATLEAVFCLLPAPKKVRGSAWNLTVAAPRRKAHAALEAVFCLLPAPRNVGASAMFVGGWRTMLGVFDTVFRMSAMPPKSCAL